MKLAVQRQKKTATASKDKTVKGTCTTKSGGHNCKIARQRGKTKGRKNTISVEVLNSVDNPSPMLLDSKLTGTVSLESRREASTLFSTQSLEFTPNGPKLKLQLFPINDATRKGLQKDGHNPHLELILGERKKISSVVKHLIAKWDKSRMATGELMVFPYEAELENLASGTRWSIKDTHTTATDVYKSVGCPTIFRLRYGWLSDIKPQNSAVDCGVQDVMLTDDKQKHCSETSEEHGSTIVGDLPSQFSDKPLLVEGNTEQKDNVNIEQNCALSWADGLTNISFGDLLARATDGNEQSQLPAESNSRPQLMPFSCDSFDAAIAAHITRLQAPNQSMHMPLSSIWDAEETCHAFPVRKNLLEKENLASSGNADPSCSQNPHFLRPQDVADKHFLTTEVHVPREESASILHPQKHDIHCCGTRTELQPQPQVQDSNENSIGLAGINWDSMGPLEYGMAPKLTISNDSTTFGSLLASSRDGHRSCSLTNTDKIKPSTLNLHL